VISSNSSAEQTGEDMPVVVAPDPAPRPVRRTFTAAYRLSIRSRWAPPVGRGFGRAHGQPQRDDSPRRAARSICRGRPPLGRTARWDGHGGRCRRGV